MRGLYFIHVGELLGKSPETLAQLLLWDNNHEGW